MSFTDLAIGTSQGLGQAITNVRGMQNIAIEQKRAEGIETEQALNAVKLRQEQEQEKLNNVPIDVESFFNQQNVVSPEVRELTLKYIDPFLEINPATGKKTLIKTGRMPIAEKVLHTGFVVQQLAGAQYASLDKEYNDLRSQIDAATGGQGLTPETLQDKKIRPLAMKFNQVSVARDTMMRNIYATNETYKDVVKEYGVDVAERFFNGETSLTNEKTLKDKELDKKPSTIREVNLGDKVEIYRDGKLVETKSKGIAPGTAKPESKPRLTKTVALNPETGDEEYLFTDGSFSGRKASNKPATSLDAKRLTELVTAAGDDPSATDIVAINAVAEKMGKRYENITETRSIFKGGDRKVWRIVDGDPRKDNVTAKGMLDPSNEEHKKIVDGYLKKAGGNVEKAKELAKKDNWKF